MSSIKDMIKSGAAAALLVGALAACGNTAQSDKKADEKPTPSGEDAAGPVDNGASVKAAALPDDMSQGLLVALSQFEVGPDKKVLPKPGPARLDIFTREGGAWRHQMIEDATSNVFHKAFVYTPPGGEPGIVTLGAMGAAVKIWRKKEGKFVAETLWEKDFGGKFSRMRDAEVADLYGDGVPTIAVATHDQGVVATVRPNKEGGWEVKEIDALKDTFVHEIEIGDLDGDGKLEFYSTPSEPNRLDGSEQSGHVMRYTPTDGGKGVVVADLGNRHAKEILVADVDGDKRDELYVAVEALTEKVGEEVRVMSPVEIRRYDAGTDPTKGAVVGLLKDRLCRFLTAGDVDGDGKKELVAAPFSSGLWLLRPGADPRAEWDKSLIDKDSSGFEHSAILLDLDKDGRDELYVASDKQGEVRRYVWNGGGFDKSVISTREVPRSVFTWNLTPVPVELVK